MTSRCVHTAIKTPLVYSCETVENGALAFSGVVDASLLAHGVTQFRSLKGDCASGCPLLDGIRCGILAWAGFLVRRTLERGPWNSIGLEKSLPETPVCSQRRPPVSSTVWYSSPSLDRQSIAVKHAVFLRPVSHERVVDRA